MGPSPLYHVTYRMTMSVSVLFFRPNADDLRPWIFQDEIDTLLNTKDSLMLLVVWFGLRPVSMKIACGASGTCYWRGLV